MSKHGLRNACVLMKGVKIESVAMSNGVSLAKRVVDFLGGLFLLLIMIGVHVLLLHFERPKRWGNK